MSSLEALIGSQGVAPLGNIAFAQIRDGQIAK
jgi:hypothetical protein